MIGEGEPLETAAGAPNNLAQAREAAEATTETVRQTTQSIGSAIEAGRRPGGPLDTLARSTREAPLGALAIAFLVGVAFTRRLR